MRNTNSLPVQTREYSPSEISRILSEDYGHKVTPSVIRKWDNRILSEAVRADREKGEVRKYTAKDLNAFNTIAVLRNLGYTIGDIKNILNVIIHGDNNTNNNDSDEDSGRERYHEITEKIERLMRKQKLAFEQVVVYLRRELNKA